MTHSIPHYSHLSCTRHADTDQHAAHPSNIFHNCSMNNTRRGNHAPAFCSKVSTEMLYARFMKMYRAASHGAAEQSVPHEGVMPRSARDPATQKSKSQSCNFGAHTIPRIVRWRMALATIPFLTHLPTTCTGTRTRTRPHARMHKDLETNRGRES